MSTKEQQVQEMTNKIANFIFIWQRYCLMMYKKKIHELARMKKILWPNPIL